MHHTRLQRGLIAFLCVLVCTSTPLHPTQAAVNGHDLEDVPVVETRHGPNPVQLPRESKRSSPEQTGTLTIQDNNFEGNGDYGLESNTAIKAENNWWRDPNGPQHASNPLGNGDAVSDNVDFDPWLTSAVDIGIPLPPYPEPGAIVLSQNSFEDNGTYGVQSSIPIAAENNWWGHASGPYHPTLNQDGQGDNVSDNVDFDPWLTSPPASDTIAADVTDFISDSRQQILDVSDAASDVSQVGDYFLDKLDEDKVRRVVNLGMNAFSLARVNWSRVGRGLNHIATPGYQAALHASWRGWADDSVTKHWDKLAYDAIQNDRQLVFEKTARSGLEYYAEQAGKKWAKDKVKSWLIDTLTPGSGTPFADILGSPATDLGDGYRSELLREQDELLGMLPSLGLTPAEEAAYRADMLARQEAHAQLTAQLEDHRDLLWDIYQDKLADESKWWKFWGPLLAKWVVIGGATLMWDGPGYYVASAGLATFDLIYDAVKDTQAIEHDQKILDQSLRFLEGRVSSAYTQIALNTVSGLYLIRTHTAPQVADGTVGHIATKSFGHYRLWPCVWWADESSQVDLVITNTTTFDTAYLTSAAYTHTGFWTGAERLLPEGESLQLAGGEGATATIKLKLEDGGVSPDKRSAVDLLVLGATETGLYPVATAIVTWDPTRVEQSNRLLAQAPVGISASEAADAPAWPYPLWSVVTTPPESTDHEVVIGVFNPFTLTVSATVTQAVPAGFAILDDGGGTVAGDSLVWTEVISQETGFEVRAVLGWESTPGASTTLPGPELAFHDPDTGQGDTYTAPDETVSAAWPLEVAVDIPMEWESGVDVTIPVTLTNIATSVTAEGIFTGTVESVDGTVLWSQNYSLNIAPGKVQVVSMPVQITTSDGYALLYGEVALGTAHEHVFREIVAVEGARKVYLPLVLRNR